MGIWMLPLSKSKGDWLQGDYALVTIGLPLCDSSVTVEANQACLWGHDGICAAVFLLEDSYYAERCFT